jgi:hypothetical protein
LLIKPINQPSVSFIDWRSWLIFVVVCLLTILPQFIRIDAVRIKSLFSLLSHPIVLIILAGVAGYVIYTP